MAEFILKDRYGKDRSFDKETIFVQGADGELMQFTHGAGNPNIESLEITENGTYTVPEGVDGYNPVTVNVPAPEIKLQDKTITENGEYTADSGFDGFGKVSVEVKGSGGGSMPVGVYNKVISFLPYPGSKKASPFVLNDKLYVITDEQYGDTSYHIFLYENGTFTKKVGNAFTVSPTSLTTLELDGKVHIVSSNNGDYWTWDGVSETVEKQEITFTLPGKTDLFVLNDEMWGTSSTTDGYLMRLKSDGTKEWFKIDVSYKLYPFVYKGEVYSIKGKNLIKIDTENKTFETVANNLDNIGYYRKIVIGRYVYIFTNSWMKKLDMEKFQYVYECPFPNASMSVPVVSQNKLYTVYDNINTYINAVYEVTE